MSQVQDITEKNLIIKGNNDYSDNHTKLNKLIFWRYEYTQDTKIMNKSFIKSINNDTTWSNYRDKGYLNVYRKN